MFRYILLLVFVFIICFSNNNNSFVYGFFFNNNNNNNQQQQQQNQKLNNNNNNNNYNNNNNNNNNNEIKFEIDKKYQERINSGKESLELIKKNSISNRCWEECIDILLNGCKNMDDISKSRLAVKLTNCHLAKSGLETYRCNYDMSIEECTKSMNQVSFVTYTNFYISTENICYYLSQELFQDRTERSINQLLSSSHQSIQSLNQITSKSNKLSDQLQESLDNQNQLISNQQSLKHSIDDNLISLNDLKLKSSTIHTNILDQSEKQSQLLDSHNKLLNQYQQDSQQSLKLINNIKQSSDNINLQTQQSLDNQNQLISSQHKSIQIIETIESITNSSLLKLKNLIEFQDQLLDTNQIILNVLHQLNYLQNWILSEVIDFKSIYFYLFTLIIIYIISSTKRTKSTRLPLIIGLVIDILIERYICISSTSTRNITITILEVLNNIPIINLIWYYFKQLIDFNLDMASTTSTTLPNNQYIYLVINNIRLLFVLYSIIIIFSSVYFYKDYEKENHQLLLTIVDSITNLEKKHKQLKKSLYTQGVILKHNNNNNNNNNHSLISIKDNNNSGSNNNNKS